MEEMRLLLLNIGLILTSVSILILVVQGQNKESRIRALEGKIEEMEDKNRE